MTSGNLSDEPIAHLDDDARARLGPLCDGLLMHDREIEVQVRETSQALGNIFANQSFSQTGIDLQAAFAAAMEKKTSRDRERHASNPKLQP